MVETSECSHADGEGARRKRIENVEERGNGWYMRFLRRERMRSKTPVKELILTVRVVGHFSL